MAKPDKNSPSKSLRGRSLRPTPQPDVKKEAEREERARTRADLLTLVYNPDTTIEQLEAMAAVSGDRDPDRRVPYLIALAAIEESRPYMTEEVYRAAIEHLDRQEERRASLDRPDRIDP